ncbi:hypothetical protein PENSPDRAFT_655000 [Peniophora sp. CONT]|nr:hypothetical protein PENSPDRAFT_655000 [Peniophora sp. CONT]
MGLQINWRDARRYRMWHMLWTQGMIYLMIAALAEVPNVTLLILDINPVLNTILGSPETITLALCATRMFRSLNTAVRGGPSEIFTNGVSHGRIPTACQTNEVQLATLENGRIKRERL